MLFYYGKGGEGGGEEERGVIGIYLGRLRLPFAGE